MLRNILPLNGDWLVDFLSDTPYNETVVPVIYEHSDSLTTLSVPGYWEDMTQKLASTQLYRKLNINPLYTDQSYPMTGYCPDMYLPNPVGCLAYEKDFVLESIPKNAELFIGGAQNTVSAWVNGVYLGRHEGYSTPFGFSIPHGTLKLGENRITLAVSNNRLQGYKGRPVSGLTSRAANECTGGIYGNVELRSYPDGLRDLWVTVNDDCTSFTVHTEGAGNIRKIVTITYKNETVSTATIPAGEETVTITAQGLLRWTPETPELYQVTVSTENQSLSCSFGLRRLTVEGTRLYLNGEPYYFRGICEHCYQYSTVHPTQDKKYYLGVIQKLKALGFNSIRFHTWIPPHVYMEAADELGMLLEVESPNNTALAEWEQIVRFCRRHPSVNLYSTGNELQINEDYEAHLQACATLVHTRTDGLFSPMSAMRGVEYMLREEDPRVQEPFEHNPQRLARMDAYCDLYNSYSLGLTSYDSSLGTQPVLDQRNGIYGKPLLSHEICIQGTYIDLSLEERYQNTRIGKTQFMSSVRTHLAQKGLLEKADIYYKNSVRWQSLLRKHCFETVRRCQSFAGYDFLGDIDTHWHTFGYCVGMMNEFYELKPGETPENVLRYNSPTVLLADLPRVNYTAGESVEIPLLVSHYRKDLAKATLHICLQAEGEVLAEKQVAVGPLQQGQIMLLERFCFAVPQKETPAILTLRVRLTAGQTLAENQWELYAFPKVHGDSGNAVVCHGCSLKQLTQYMEKGETVVIFGTEPFTASPVTFQLSIAGRTTGHLATVIAHHPVMDQFPHRGYCAKQFENMLNGGFAAVLDGAPGAHDPIIDIATSYKNARREGLLFEYRVGSGRLLVCTLHLDEADPAAQWLKGSLLAYVNSRDFAPGAAMTVDDLRQLCAGGEWLETGDSNRAMNKNDITA